MIGLAEFIKTHVDDINNNNFTKVYRELHDEVQVGESVSKFTDMLLDAEINPLMYMESIPAHYMDGSKRTSVSIPNNITSIGACAFIISSLTSVIIPNSVTSIGFYAFRGCTLLTNITIPDSVTRMDEGAFWNCVSLASVTILGNITSINEYVFDGCKGLKSVTIPNSVTSIGKSAFRGCRGLKITFNGTKSQWDTIKKESKWKYTSSKFTIHCTDGDLMI